jgi:hypothetical protein
VVLSAEERKRSQTAQRNWSRPFDLINPFLKPVRKCHLQAIAWATVTIELGSKLSYRQTIDLTMAQHVLSIFPYYFLN